LRQVRLSPKARADLDVIWDFTAQRWGLDQAEVYVHGLGETMKLLAASPHLGRGIDVIRILHKSMDVDRHL
jgi:toxin ParE1/3/4